MILHFKATGAASVGGPKEEIRIVLMRLFSDYAGPDRELLILVVDDKQLVADTRDFVINENGFDARAVYCGGTGVMLARAIKPDVLVSDVLMKVVCPA